MVTYSTFCAFRLKPLFNVPFQKNTPPKKSCVVKRWAKVILEKGLIGKKNGHAGVKSTILARLLSLHITVCVPYLGAKLQKVNDKQAIQTDK